MKIRLQHAILAAGISLLAVLAIACAQADLQSPTNVHPPTPSDSQPQTVTFGGSGSTLHPILYVSPSLDEQIFISDTIVRASFKSATAGTEPDPNQSGAHRAVNNLTFTVHEYLKGRGPSELAVVVRDDHDYNRPGHHSSFGYLNQTEALTKARNLLQQRNTTWDNRQAVLFLVGSQTPFRFTLSNDVVQDTFDYSIDTLSRAWLPQLLTTTSSSTRSSTRTSDNYITDGSVEPLPTISLSELRSKINLLAATLAQGANIPGFRDCILDQILHERHRRATPWTPPQLPAALTSGSAAGTELYRDEWPSYYRNEQYQRFWLSGPDAALFQTLTNDNDSDPLNGYSQTLASTRPMPAGQYRVNYHTQHYSYIPCNFIPDNYYVFTITVTAPAGTVHEALFDPAASADATGFSGAAGTLEPAEFSLSGTTTTITQLQWEAGTVTMELSPYVSLAGQQLDIIALDASVALSLRGSAATVAGSALTWPVATQPWSAGDQLMVSIRDAAGAADSDSHTDSYAYANGHTNTSPYGYAYTDTCGDPNARSDSHTHAPYRADGPVQRAGRVGRAGRADRDLGRRRQRHGLHAVCHPDGRRRRIRATGT